MKVCIIKGNPLFIKKPIAISYYKEIEKFLYDNGVNEVIFDPGEDYTCPPKADFYIGHSRGASRAFVCKRKLEGKIFLKFGVEDGISHPKDIEWLKHTWSPTKLQEPLPEHFEFVKEQKDAILKAIEITREKELIDKDLLEYLIS